MVENQTDVKGLAMLFVAYLIVSANVVENQTDVPELVMMLALWYVLLVGRIVTVMV